MVDQCSTCFFGRAAPASAGAAAGKRFCHGKLPYQNPDPETAYPWKPVQDDWWCGDGADSSTGRCFSSTVSGKPGTGGAGPGYLATSATSLTIASSGSIAGTTQLNLAYTAGARVRFTSTGSGAWMEGVVTSYDAAGLLTFTADKSSGSGTHTDWDINLAGQPGVAGTGIASKGSFTCTNTRPIVVADAAVLAGSIVLLTPANATAAKCVSNDTLPGGPIGIYHVPASNVAGVSFSVDSGNGGVFLGTETFNYIILN